MSALLAQSPSRRHRSHLTPDLPETLDGAASDNADLDFLAFIPGTGIRKSVAMEESATGRPAPEPNRESEAHMRNRCRYWAPSPARSPGEYGASAKLAERVGFEPTVQFPAHTLSKRAP